MTDITSQLDTAIQSLNNTNSPNVTQTVAAMPQAQYVDLTPQNNTPNSIPSLHPELVEHAQAMIDYFAESVAKHNELVAHIENLKAQLEFVSNSLNIGASNLVVTAANDVNKINNSVQSASSFVQKQGFFAAIIHWLFKKR